MKPHQLFLFGLCVTAPLVILLIIHPRDGIHLVGNLTLQFPSFRETFFPESDSLSQDTDKSLFSDIHDPIEMQRKLDSLREARFRIQYPNGDPSLLHPLFESLQELSTAKKALHVLHFGGSQIEGDRITEHLRARLQEKFGGYGPGWLPAIPFVGSRSYTIEHSDNWQRHALFGLVDSTVQHRHYGAMGLYARFSEPADSIAPDTTKKHAWIQYASRYSADKHVRTFNRFTLFYGYHTHPVTMKLIGGENVLAETILHPAEKTQVFQIRLPQTRRDLRVEFTGIESPEVYGVSLEGSSGIMVSNVSMRGQSGVHFWTQPAQQLRSMFGASNVPLIILQYGANAVPYTDTQEAIEEYCYRFGKNIEYLKKMIPGVSVIVIGPADMAMKKGTAWISYPMFIQLRDAMKETSFAAGAAYWDPFEAMGGTGTIQQWVAATPPLAASDHVHFTLDGAAQIAQWFYDALMKDYDQFLATNGMSE